LGVRKCFELFFDQVIGFPESHSAKMIGVCVTNSFFQYSGWLYGALGGQDAKPEPPLYDAGYDKKTLHQCFD
jgi:hypothetical protein